MHRLSTRAAAVTTLFALVACGGGEADTETPPAESTPAPAAAEDATLVVADVGFATPESVLHDPVADVYLVSNIDGGPVDADGNGFISRVSPSGEVLELRWIDGTAEGVTLDAPKGMALSGDLLYVSDITCVRTFDRTSGAPVGATCIDGATFLNDVAAHPSAGVVVTDTGMDATFSPTGADAVYHVADGQVGPVAVDPELGGPNGVATSGDGAVVVTFRSGEILRVAGDGSVTPLLQVEGAQFDGVEVLDDGRILVSDWTSSCVNAFDGQETLTCLVPDVESPADIGFDARRGRVLIPLFNANEVRIVPIG